MFMQVIQGKVRDPDLLRSQSEQWRAQIKPGATGYLGSTTGITDDGQAVVLVRFESEEAARRNSERPEQGEWWSRTEPAFDGTPRFIDCREVDLIMGGGSDQARFVQVMQGRAADQEKMRAMGVEMENEIGESRPDVLGGIVGWHGDGGFTQAIFFTDEESARKGEATMTEQDDMAEWDAMLDGPMTFFDIRNPDFD